MGILSHAVEGSVPTRVSSQACRGHDTVTEYQRMLDAIYAAYEASEGRALTDYKFGLTIGADAKTVSRIREGKNTDPRESIAKRIREEYAKVSGNPSIVPCGTSSVTSA